MFYYVIIVLSYVLVLLMEGVGRGPRAKTRATIGDDAGKNKQLVACATSGCDVYSCMGMGKGKGTGV